MNSLPGDLDHILSHTKTIWEEFRNEQIFITGGTGFFGCWLLETFGWANEKMGLNASVVVLTRNADAFRTRAPHLAANPAIHFWVGDVENFEFPSGHYSYIVHASNEALNYLNERNCRLMTNHMVGSRKTCFGFCTILRCEKSLVHQLRYGLWASTPGPDPRA